MIKNPMKPFTTTNKQNWSQNMNKQLQQQPKKKTFNALKLVKSKSKLGSTHHHKATSWNQTDRQSMSSKEYKTHPYETIKGRQPEFI